ncbi:MAG: MFS transporter [Deltaproteobacteria bacterium]|nr:MAG: MFS transporter [Deltaproteobacteria bacterium]
MKAHTTHVQSESYKWLVLTLSTFTFTFVVAIPRMSLPVLFDEISADLNLSLVQVGWIWGIGYVLGILVGFIGGPVGDRFGPRRTLAVACLVMGMAGAARGLSNGFTMLALTTLITGFASSSIPMNVHKTCGVWFPKEQLGMANGVVAVGMALGFLLGSLLAATVFSPLFGGWRNVLFVYGAVAILFGMYWLFSQEKAGPEDQQSNQVITFREAIEHVIRLRNVWILCIATAGVSGCVNGMLGFLPLYLRDLGWEPAIADSTLASFHAVSMLFAIPIALLSDRIGSRRGVLMTAALLIGIGTGLLGFSNGVLILAAVLLAGISRDGFMAITMTAVIEEKGIGPRFAGSAAGLIMSVMGIANVFAPPVGNWLAKFGSGLPFLFWASLVFLGFVGYLFMRLTAVGSTNGIRA